MNKERTYYQDDRPEMLSFLPNEYATVLEIGCGEGAFLRQLDPKSEFWGVEPNKESADNASHMLMKVFVGKYEDVTDEIPDDYFDVIVCNDVIEHMTDHDYFFDSIQSKLKHSGVLIASIPNIRYYKTLFELLVYKEWQYRDFGILDRTHFRFFTEKSLLKTLHEHNFIVERFSGINRVPTRRLLFNIISLLTLGYYSDIQYPRFGFCVKKEG